MTLTMHPFAATDNLGHPRPERPGSALSGAENLLNWLAVLQLIKLSVGSFDRLLILSFNSVRTSI